MIGIVGGTALELFSEGELIQEFSVATPYGAPSAPLSVLCYRGVRFVFIARHGRDHHLAPHRINYRANMWALYQLGVSAVVGLAAVGGMDAQAAPERLVIPHQIIDYTTGRENTYFDGVYQPLAHVDFTEPYTPWLRQSLLDACRVAGSNCVESGVYAAVQGPRLETAAEVTRLMRDGCTLVGMTGMPEAVLARELGMAYACCALVVNWAAGLGEGEIGMDAVRAHLARGQIDLHRMLDVWIAAAAALKMDGSQE